MSLRTRRRGACVKSHWETGIPSEDHSQGREHGTPDPACGMEVEVSIAAGNQEYGGRKHYFCIAASDFGSGLNMMCAT